MKQLGDDVLTSAFEKNGLIYRVMIALDSEDDPEQLIPSGRFKGIFLHPLEKNVCVFYISMDEDGRWIPDKREIIDPWVADCIGEMIEKNLV